MCTTTNPLFQIIFLYFIITIDIAINAHSFAIIRFINVRAGGCISSRFTAVLMITVIAHTLGIMLSIGVLTICYTHFGTASFFLKLRFALLLFFFLKFSVFLKLWFVCCLFDFRTWSIFDRLNSRWRLILLNFALWSSSRID